MCFNDDAEITTTGTTTSTTGSTVRSSMRFEPPMASCKILRYKLKPSIQISGTWTTTTSSADDYYDNATMEKSTTNTSRTTRNKESKTCHIDDWADFRFKISQVSNSAKCCSVFKWLNKKAI